jgi:hypothetical protein
MALQRTAQIDSDPFSNENDPFEGGAPAVTGAPAETENHQALAVAPSASVPVVASRAKGYDVSEVLSPEEMEGLELGFGSFPIVTLDGKEFDCKGQNWTLGDSFTGRIFSYRPKYLAKVRADKDAIKELGIDPVIVYTYDDFRKDPGALDTNGVPIADRVAYWKGKGKGYEFDKYMEVNFEMIDPGQPWDGVLVQLSVSKASVPKFSAYVMAALAGQQKKRYDAVITKVHKGDRITVGTDVFRPWAFSY